MRLALLIGANPKTCNSGAVVRLMKGKWVLGFQGVKDSTFNLEFKNPPLQHGNIGEGEELLFVEPRYVQISIDNKGSEESVSIFADRIED